MSMSHPLTLSKDGTAINEPTVAAMIDADLPVTSVALTSARPDKKKRLYNFKVLLRSFVSFSAL